MPEAIDQSAQRGSSHFLITAIAGSDIHSASKAKQIISDSVKARGFANQEVEDWFDSADEQSMLALADGVQTAIKHSGGKNIMPDVAHFALRSAIHGAKDVAAKAKDFFDSAAAGADIAVANGQSLVPNALKASIVTAIANPFPLAHYAATPGRSGELILPIATAVANKNFGAYTQGQSITGINSGNALFNPIRLHKLSKLQDGKHFGGKVTQAQKTPTECDQTVAEVPFVRGKTQLLVNGKVVGKEESGNRKTGDSIFSGKCVIAGSERNLQATFNPSTGAATVTVTLGDDLPNSTEVVILAVLDNSEESRVPSLSIVAETYSLLCHPMNATVQWSAEGARQFSDELGIDPISASIAYMQAQIAGERYRYSLTRMAMMARHSEISGNFNLNFSGGNNNVLRSASFADMVIPKIDEMSRMAAVKTEGCYGITTLFVGNEIASVIGSMGRDFFNSSGNAPQATPYYLGSMAGGRYEVYVDPAMQRNADSSFNNLCGGRSDVDVCRSPIIIGELVPMTINNLPKDAAFNGALSMSGTGFHDANPYEQALAGVCSLSVTGLGI